MGVPNRETSSRETAETESEDYKIDVANTSPLEVLSFAWPSRIATEGGDVVAQPRVRRSYPWHIPSELGEGVPNRVTSSREIAETETEDYKTGRGKHQPRQLARGGHRAEGSAQVWPRDSCHLDKG